MRERERVLLLGARACIGQGCCSPAIPRMGIGLHLKDMLPTFGNHHHPLLSTRTLTTTAPWSCTSSTSHPGPPATSPASTAGRRSRGSRPPRSPPPACYSRGRTRPGRRCVAGSIRRGRRRRGGVRGAGVRRSPWAMPGAGSRAAVTAAAPGEPTSSPTSSSKQPKDCRASNLHISSGHPISPPPRRPPPPPFHHAAERAAPRGGALRFCHQVPWHLPGLQRPRPQHAGPAVRLGGLRRRARLCRGPPAQGHRCAAAWGCGGVGAVCLGGGGAEGVQRGLWFTAAGSCTRRGSGFIASWIQKDGRAQLLWPASHPTCP